MSDNLLLPASNAFKHKDEQFPIQASIDALRAAIVSRNGLLEVISEQIRRGFEASTSQQNAAAARAENLDAELIAIEKIEAAFCNRLAALEATAHANGSLVAERLSALENSLVEHDAYAKALNEKMASSEYVKITNQMREFMGAIALHIASGEMEINHKSAQLQHKQQLKAKKAARKRSK